MKPFDIIAFGILFALVLFQASANYSDISTRLDRMQADCLGVDYED